MKIQCDVCNKDEASVFCTADEAALCDGCDHRVHHANKLASKHQRFSLLHPSSEQFPICDICQEKRALLFCQQDRAILCSDCDVPIHTANEHTKKHNRFLLTGVKLSATACLYKSSSSSTNDCDSAVPDSKSRQPSFKNPISVSGLTANSNPNTTTRTLTSSPSSEITTTTTITTVNKGGDNLFINGSPVSTSSISEYLQMLPGWHVEDLLDSSSGFFGFNQDDDGKLPFMDTDFDSNISPFSSEKVPQAATPVYLSQYASQIGSQFGFKETREATNTVKANNRRWPDDGFTVPQISPPYFGSKRARPLW